MAEHKEDDECERLKELYRQSKRDYLKLTWLQSMYTICGSNNPIDADACFLNLRLTRDDPFYASDFVDGYTNNGYYNCWGKERPKNVKYVVALNAHDISKALKDLEPGINVIVKN